MATTADSDPRPGPMITGAAMMAMRALPASVVNAAESLRDFAKDVDISEAVRDLKIEKKIAASRARNRGKRKREAKR